MKIESKSWKQFQIYRGIYACTFFYAKKKLQKDKHAKPILYKKLEVIK